MMNFIKTMFQKENLSKKTSKIKTFFDLSSKDQKKILEKSIREANDQQRELVEKYEKSVSQHGI